MSSGFASGGLSLAQSVQRGTSTAQAGLALTAAEASGDGIPVALADMLAQAPEAVSFLRASGSSMQAWLDIATGRLALQAAREIRGRAVDVQEAPAPEPQPAPPPLKAREPEPQVRRQEKLEVARQSFEAALESLDAQLEPELAAVTGGWRGGDPAAVADSAAARMRRDPARATQAHALPDLPGVLALLRWDVAPLTEPVRETRPLPA